MLFIQQDGLFVVPHFHHKLWEHAISTSADTEMKVRIIRAQSTMQKFSFLFGCHLGKRLLLQTDNPSMTLQSPELCAAEAHHIAQVVVASLKKECCDEDFNSFWKELENKKADLDNEDSELPRKRRHPKRLTNFFGLLVKQIRPS